MEALIWVERQIVAGNYYRILGVDQTATFEEIRVAYRAIARKNHPDTTNELHRHEVFKLAAEAYATLSDPDKRAAYDKTFRPYSGVHDWFVRNNIASQVMEQMLPKAPSQPVRGLDRLFTLKCPASMLQFGGIIEIEGNPFVVPPNTINSPWGILKGFGLPGKNGAERGDLIVYVYR